VARIARVVVPDLPHHVTQRGNRREPVFFRGRRPPSTDRQPADRLRLSAGDARCADAGVGAGPGAMARERRPLAEKLGAAGVEWLLAGMPRAAHESSSGGIASVQWSSGSGRAIRIGDAAVARDALASQGIANGISAGLSLFEGLDAGKSYCRRTRTEILSHLTTLQQLIHSCAHSAHPFWENYGDFIARAAVAHRDVVEPGGH